MPLKLLVKRLLVASVGAVFQVTDRARSTVGRVRTLAEKHGLEGRKALSHSTTDAFHLADFLFLMRRVNGATAPQKSKTPRCSIILLAYNKAEYTFQCLRSLFREIEDINSVEIIVVNNASSDETSEMLAYFGDEIRVINNSENLGFVGGCNTGAAVATGEHLIFLNNDTIVLHGWLENLLAAVETDDRVGAVGSLLIYPDGTIQEAGAIVWSDGNAYHVGARATVGDRRFTFAREVDYCSGASLLVRREIFERLGGFDERYAPGYYEDTDLCFGVRSLGYKVQFQPRSQVIHFEGITSGKDLGSGMKRFQVINRAKFVDKWRDVLERDHFECSDGNVDAASNRRRSPIVLVIDDRVPTPDRDAGSLRMLEILKILARDARVIFVCMTDRPDSEYAGLLWAEGVQTEHITSLPKLLKLKIEAAIFSRPEAAGLMKTVRAAQPAARLIYDMVDVHFLRLQREREISGQPGLLVEIAEVKRREVRAAETCDVLWCASSEDARVMREAVPTVVAAVVPTIHRVVSGGSKFDERKGLLFVGSFRHRPNTDAIHYLIDEIMPLVRAELPDITVTIVGDGAPADITAYSNESVAVRGYVPDIEPLLLSHRVFVAPLRFGAGTKGKIGEALGYGLPTVTTSIGAESMGLTHGKNILIADDPAAFAADVVRLYRDRTLWEQTAKAGQVHVSERYTPEAIAPVILDAIQKNAPARI